MPRFAWGQKSAIAADGNYNHGGGKGSGSKARKARGGKRRGRGARQACGVADDDGQPDGERLDI